MKKTQKAVSAFALAGAYAGALVVAQAAVAPQSALAETCIPAGTEAHLFSGSSTAVEVFKAWFAGEDFVPPTLETRDLQTLKVNDNQEAFGGDTVYKDTEGNFHVAKVGCK